MRARVIRVLAALAMIVGVPGGFVAFTAASASAQPIAITVPVQNGVPTSFDYEDSNQFVAVDASLETPDVLDLADFAEVGEVGPDYLLGPVAAVGTLANGEVLNALVTRVGIEGELPLLDEPVTCSLDGSGNGTCVS